MLAGVSIPSLCLTVLAASLSAGCSQLSPQLTGETPPVGRQDKPFRLLWSKGIGLMQNGKPKTVTIVEISLPNGGVLLGSFQDIIGRGPINSQLHYLRGSDGQTLWNAKLDNPASSVDVALRGKAVRLYAHWPQGQTAGGSVSDFDLATGKRIKRQVLNQTLNGINPDFTIGIGDSATYYDNPSAQPIAIQFDPVRVKPIGTLRGRVDPLSSGKNLMVEVDLGVDKPRVVYNLQGQSVKLGPKGRSWDFENYFVDTEPIGATQTRFSVYSSKPLKKVYEETLAIPRPQAGLARQEGKQGLVLICSYVRDYESRVASILFPSTSNAKIQVAEFTRPRRDYDPDPVKRNAARPDDLWISNAKAVASGLLPLDQSVYPIGPLSPKWQRVLDSRFSDDGALSYSVVSDRPAHTGPGNLSVVVRRTADGAILFDQFIAKQGTRHPYMYVQANGNLVVVIGNTVSLIGR